MYYFKFIGIKFPRGTSLVVQWLRFCASIVGGVGSILGWGTKIPRAAWCGQKIKKKKNFPQYYHIPLKYVGYIMILSYFILAVGNFCFLPFSLDYSE